MCKDTHSIRQCPNFLSETATDRFQLIKKLNLCINCLGSGHSYSTCPSQKTCKSCQKRHHSLLHFTPDATSTAATVTPTTMLVADAVPRSVLLSTLLVNIQSTHLETHTFRALLDTGSQVSFITKKCADRLSLARRRCSAQVNAFSGTSVNVVSGITSIRLSPVGKTEPLIPLDVFIVPKITDATPQSNIKSPLWPHLTNLDLADPTFNIPGPIDILLGADVAPTLLTGYRIAGQTLEPTAFGTIFGWVLMGPVSPKQENLVTSLLVTSNLSLEHSLTKFWEMEEPPNVQH